eukprot:SAG11_NODE_1966_length_3988_cov_16.269221_2_plen_533_part_00
MTVHSVDEYMRVAGELPNEDLRQLILLEKPDDFFLAAPFKARFHNLSSVKLTNDELSVLGLGHKFIPTSFGPSKRSLDKCLKQYNRRVLLRDFFAQAKAAGEYRERAAPPGKRLRTGDPTWHPLEDGTIRDEPYVPTEAVQVYLDDVGEELHARLAATAQMRVRDNLIAGQRKALAALQDKHRGIVCIEADKNLGLVVMDRSDYTTMGLEMLGQSHVEVTRQEYDLAPAATINDLCDAVIDGVREKYAAVLSRYSDLLDSWKDGPLDWKTRYLRKAVMRHPNDGTYYKVPNYREMKKVHKPGSRGVTGNHVSINQPFSLLNAVQLQPLVQQLPLYLRDADQLTRDLEQLRLRQNDTAFAIDIVRLYPSFRLEESRVAVHDAVVAHLTEQYRHSPAVLQRKLEEEALGDELRAVSLFNNYCYFDGKVFKAELGWATGTADGREMAEIVLATLEQPVLRKWRAHLPFVRRYVDDCGGWFRESDQQRNEFLHDYKHMSYFDTTEDTSADTLIMLDVECFKGDRFSRTGRLDLRTY